MNIEAMTMLSSNVGIGGGYFKLFEERYDSPEEGRRGDSYISLSQELISRHFEANLGTIDISDGEYFQILVAVRASLEASYSKDEDIFVDIFDAMGMDMRCNDLSKLRARSAPVVHKLLDYLECNAPEDVMRLWVENRKDIANARMEKMLDDMEN